jgi:predicted AAA+ superfamily ATPase
MNDLLSKSALKIGNVTTDFNRYLYERINYESKLISIKGSRGSGKTTLLLQIGARLKHKKTLYVALDDLFFSGITLYDLASQFYKMGGQLLLLDEVHKYPDWSREIKLIYDDFSDLQTIFTSSSILDIYRGESDLSRRVVAYQLHEMSFREYLLLNHKIKIEAIDYNLLLTKHQEIGISILQNFKPFQYFDGYLRHGAYPYFDGDEAIYYQKLKQTINLILEVDLPAVQNIDYVSITKIKRLLHVLSANVPFTPNISSLSEKIGLHRNNLVQALHWLAKAYLIHIYFKSGKSIGILNKPDKIWMHNPNLSYSLSQDNTDIGNKRESFFLSQVSVDHEVSIPESGDFLLDGKHYFEVGGRNKSRKQIEGVGNAYVVKDEIELGSDNVIPLWMFGLLY